MTEPFYRVVPDEANPGCVHCGHGQYWLIVDAFETATSNSYVDKDDAEEICEALNAAFEAGQKASQ